VDDIETVLKRAAKAVIDNPPMKTDAAGRCVLDEDAFKAELAKVLQDAERTMTEVSKSGPTGRARADAALRDAMFSKLYGPDGKRNEVDVSELGSVAEIRFAKVLAKTIALKPNMVSQEEFEARVRTLIDACGEDPDMLDAIEDTARRFLVTGDSKLRTPEQIAKRVADCRANQKELFDAVGGDRALRDIARELTRPFAGLPLPAGTFAKAVEALKAVDLAPFQGLGEASDSVEIHGAVMALNKAVRTVLTKSGALSKLDGQDEIGPFRSFVERALMARLPKSALRGLSAALSSPMAARLSKFYNDYGTGAKKMPKNDLPKGVNEEVASELQILMLYVDELKIAAERTLGRTKPEFIKLADAKRASNDAFYPADILEDVQQESTEFVAQKRERFLNGVVKGQSAEAGIVRNLFGGLIGPAPQDPSNMAYGKINANARKMMNAAIMGNAKQVMLGRLENTSLFKDIERGMEVTLDGVGTLSKDFKTALNQIAHFVTGRQDATFAALDDAAKKKAALVIGVLGQDSEKAIIDGTAFALDPNGDQTAVSFGGNQNRDRKIYRLDFENGQLNVNLGITYHRTALSYEGDLVESKGGITIHGSLDYTISADEMNRLVRLDFGAYDDSEATAEFNSGGENGFNPKRIEKMFKKIPEPFRINGRCRTNFEVEM